MKMRGRKEDASMRSAVWEIMIGIMQKCVQNVKVAGKRVCFSVPSISEEENGKCDSIFLSTSLSCKLWHFGSKQKAN